MENSQRILILYAIMLFLSHLNFEAVAIAAKRCFFIKAAEIIQHRYFENALTLKFGSKDMMLWKGVSILFSQRVIVCGCLYPNMVGWTTPYLKVAVNTFKKLLRSTAN